MANFQQQNRRSSVGYSHPEARPGAGRPPADRSRRALMLGGAALIGNAALIGRLWQLQVIESEDYKEQARRNRARTESIHPVRGLISDRNGEPLVRNIPIYSVWLTASELSEDRETPVLSNVAALSGESLEQLQFKLDQAKQSPGEAIQMADSVPRESALAIEERQHDLPGISIQTTIRRSYKHGNTFGHIIGFTGPIPAEELSAYQQRGVLFDEHVGRSGLEKTLQSALRGREGTRRREIDAFGRTFQEVSSQTPIVGSNAVLTLAVNEQNAVREILARHLALRTQGAGVVVVLRPDTGDIVAMVSLPDYDNNVFAKGVSNKDYELLASDPRRPLINHAISGLYPPGSTYKLVAASGALESQVILPESNIKCDGQLILKDGWAFNDWLPQGHGLVNLERAIAESCNIYFYNVSGGNPYTNLTGLGNRRLSEFERAFGFGNTTRIDLPSEAAGVVPTSGWKKDAKLGPWVTGDTYHSAIGQGLVQVTPLQIANMYAAIGNGGRLMRPRIIDKLLNPEGQVARKFQPELLGNLPVSNRHLRLLQRGLLLAVNGSSGTGKRAQSSYAVVAGKTGTAEYSGRRDSEGRLPSHAWFSGYAPASKPEYAFAVLVRDGGEGSFAAAPIARDIVDYLMTGQMPPLPQDRPDFVSPDRRL